MGEPMTEHPERSISLTSDEIKALLKASAETRRIVMGMSAAARAKYIETPWWSALHKLERARG